MIQTKWLVAVSTRAKAWTAIATALTAAAAAWVSLGFPVPASSEDIRRLDRQQAEQAIEIYQRAVRDGVIALTNPEITASAVARTIVEQQLEKDKAKLDAARERSIELTR